MDRWEVVAPGVGNISMTVELLVKVESLVTDSVADAKLDSDAVSFPVLRVALVNPAR